MVSVQFRNTSTAAHIFDVESVPGNTTVVLEARVQTHDGWIVFQTVHTALMVLALTDNCLSLFVIYGLVRLTTPLRVLTSLSFADMLAAWAMITLYFSTSANSPHHLTCRDVLHTSFLLSAHNVVALSLSSLAASHFIATFRPLHYDNLLSARRVWVALGTVWTLASLLGHVQFVLAAGSAEQSRSGYCETVSGFSYVALILSTVIAVTSLLIAVAVYSAILIHLRPVDVFLHQPPAGLVDGRHRSTRGVVTGMLLFSCYALSWLPYLSARQIHTSSTQHVVVSLSATLLLLGCTANPIIYGCRMTTLQTGYSRLWSRTGDLTRWMWSRCRRLHSADTSQLPTTPLNQLSSICY